jgi:hypothetical protein
MAHGVVAGLIKADNENNAGDLGCSFTARSPMALLRSAAEIVDGLNHLWDQANFALG